MSHLSIEKLAFSETKVRMCQAHAHIAIYTEKTFINENNLVTKEIKMHEYISLDSFHYRSKK